jgi:hypothetical protein
MKPKTKRLLEYLQAGYKLSTLDGVRYGVGVDLRKRVSELRQLGYSVRSVWEKGDGVRYKRYFL